MAGLQIYLLGPFQVLRDGQVLTSKDWRSKQARTICKLLVARRGGVVTIDQLAEILWPGEAPEAMRGTLHVRVSQLRNLLEIGKEIIQTVEGGYRFSLDDSCWVDVAAFETLADQGRACQDEGHSQEAIQTYEQARGLYRGDFLEEELYEDWTLVERERLRERYLTLLTELAECYAQQGRYRRAIAVCQQVQVVDPCREAIYVRMMLYHYYAGERAQALRVFQRCQQILAGELEVAPLPSTQALAGHIQAGTLWSASGVPRYPPPAYEGRLYEVPYSLWQPPFVGRGREYAWLLAQVNTGPPGIMLIEGESGVGKTRLLEEAAGYLAGQNYTILQANASLGNPAPYGILADALRSAGELWPLPGLDPHTLAALGALFPEVHTWCATKGTTLPGLPELPPDSEQQRLLAALERLVAARFTGPAVLLVDNAQRADRQSVQACLRLAEYVIVVFIVRTDETPAHHALRQALQALPAGLPLHTLNLEPLPSQALHDLLVQFAGHDLPQLAGLLFERTGGNPLFALALLQHLFENGSLYVTPPGKWSMVSQALDTSLPITITKTIETRLQRLARPPRRAFDLAAVLGSDFSFEWLQHASGVLEEELLTTLDALLDSGLLIEPRAASRGEYSLVHDLYAQVAYQTLPAVRRRRLHHRAAEALIATGVDLDALASQIAQHFNAAQLAPQAAHWYTRAAAASQQRHAYQEALDYYQQALELAPSPGGQIWMDMGKITHHLARYQESLTHYQQALDAWGQLGDLVAQVQAYYALAESNRELSHFEAAAQQARRGLQLADDLPGEPGLKARGEIILSNALRSGQLAPRETVRQHLETALQIARSTGARQLEGEATFWLGVVAINAGEAEAALVYDEEARQHFQHTAQLGWLAIAHNNLAYHALLAGQPERAGEAARTGLELARQIGSLHSQGWLLSTLGEIQTYLGELESARQALEEGLALITRWGPPRLRPGMLSDLARVAAAQGNWERALGHLTQAFSLAQKTAPQFIPRLNVHLAEAHLARGEIDIADQHTRLALTGAQAKSQHGVLGQAWRLQAQVHAARQEIEEASQSFQHSLEILETLNDRLEAGRTHAAWGAWLCDREETGAGSEHLATARALFTQCAARLDLQRLPPAK